MRPVYKRLWVALVAAIGAVMLGLLAALLLDLVGHRESAPEPEPVVINLVYAFQNPQWNACVETVVSRFEADNPGIRVEYEIRYADAVYEDMLSKLVARDELGDIVQLKEPTAYARAGLIAPLPSSLAEQSSSRCELSGQTYAMSALASTTGVVYNKALFRECGVEPPETYEDLLSLCAALKRQGVTPIGVGGKDLWHMEYWLNHFLRADILAEDPDFLAECTAGTSSWQDEAAGQMFTHLSQLFARGYVDGRWLSTPDSALAYHLAQGEVAMVFSGPWLAFDAQKLDPALDLGWFYVPNEAGQTVAGESADVFWAVTASCAADSARYDAAVKFLEYFYSPGIYEDVCAGMAGFSALRDPARGQYQPAAIVREVSLAHEGADLRLSAYVGDANTPAGFEKRLLNILMEMCQGQYTPEEAQARAQQAWEQCMEVEGA